MIGYVLVCCYRAHDNSKFASCGRDKDVFMWDVPTAKVIRKFEGHEHVSDSNLLHNAEMG